VTELLPLRKRASLRARNAGKPEKGKTKIGWELCTRDMRKEKKDKGREKGVQGGKVRKNEECENVGVPSPTGRAMKRKGPKKKGFKYRQERKEKQNARRTLAGEKIRTTEDEIDQGGKTPPGGKAQGF